MVGKEQRFTFWERLDKALRERGTPMTQTAVAKELKLTQPAVSGWNRPNVFPEVRTGVEIAQLHGICLEWLYLERLPMLPDTPKDKHAQELSELWPNLNDTIRERIVGYAHVNADPGTGPPGHFPDQGRRARPTR